MQDCAGTRHAELRAAQALPARVPTTRAGEVTRRLPLTVVLVTDDDHFASTLVDHLDEHDSFTVLGVMAHEGTAVTFTSRRDPRIVLVDLRMAGLAEERLIERLRVAAPTTIIAAVRGSGSVEEESDLRTAGADLYTSGAITLNDLVERLAR